MSDVTNWPTASYILAWQLALTLREICLSNHSYINPTGGFTIPYNAEKVPWNRSTKRAIGRSGPKVRLTLT